MKMMLSCSLATFANQEPTDALETILAAGLRYVDLIVDAANADAWATLLQEHGLAIASVEWSVEKLDELDATSMDEPLALAQRLEVGHVVVTVPVDAEDKDQRRDLTDRVRQLGGTAGERGVTLCLLPRGDFCDTRWIGPVIAEIDHPAVALGFDTGGYLRDNPGSNGEVALQRVLGHVAALRLTEYDEFSSESNHPALGLGGSVDFARALQIMRAVEFSGPCSIYFTPSECLDQIRQHLDDSMVTLRDCGWLDP